jgi:hypothetical protein
MQEASSDQLHLPIRSLVLRLHYKALQSLSRLERMATLKSHYETEQDVPAVISKIIMMGTQFHACSHLVDQATHLGQHVM